MTNGFLKTPPQAAYDILGVSRSDDFQTIRSAWRRLVKANHPDLPGNDTAAATARLADINDAWDALRHHSAAGARDALRAKRERAEAFRQAAERAQARARATETAEAAARRAERDAAAEAERRVRMEEAAARAAAREASRAQAEELARIERARRAAVARAALRPVADKYNAARVIFDQAAVQTTGLRANLCA